MSKKTAKPKIISGQLTLFDLSGFEKETANSQYADCQPRSKKRSNSAKEATTKYTVTQKPSPASISNDIEIEQVIVPIEIAFDVCQGIRDVKQFWLLNNKPEMEVVFDGRHLDLASYYVSGSKEFFRPEEQYLVGKGGLINLSNFFNLLRCQETLDAWSQEEYQKIGKQPIKKFDFVLPQEKAVNQLWNNLGMPNPRLRSTSNTSQFQSRFITPILWVDKQNENNVFNEFLKWIQNICKQLGSNIKTDLSMRAIPEIVANLVKHGFGGLFCVAVWPSGQIEVLWSNPIAHLKNWPPEDTAYGLAEGLQNRKKGGAGMKYIYEELLPRYNGVLEVNYKDIDLCFYSEGGYEILGQGCRRDESLPSSGNELLPNSILFTMHLFCPDTKDSSINNEN